MAIKAGIDSIEHPLPRSDAAVAQITKRGITLVPTMVAYRVIMRNSGCYFGSTSRRFELNELVPTMVAYRVIMRNSGCYFGSTSRRFELNENQVAKMRRAGVKMGIGLDVVAMAGTDFLLGSYIDELESFTRVGFTKSEALVAATKTGAEIIRMGDRLSMIETGKLADIIVVDGNVVDGNPDEDFPAIRGNGRS